MERIVDMARRTLPRINPLLSFAICLILGCSNGGSAGCGSSTKGGSISDGSRGSGAGLASDLLGVYRVHRYQGSQGGCEQLMALPEAPAYLVLYGFQPNYGSAKARLGGAFCGDPSLCRALAEKGSEPTIGYSFISGDDASGWHGWAIVDTGHDGDECRASVQSHTLKSTAERVLRIETKTVETVFAPLVEEEVATCKNRHALAAAKADLPCKALLVLEATREGGL
jgi:hypothetical protein